MTPERINRAIAEWMGKPYHKPTEEEIKSGCYYQYEPNYCNDLNAMREAANNLSQDQQESFVHNLIGIIVNPVEVEYGPLNLTQADILWMVSHATSEQRAESLLRTIGRWEEE